MRAWWRTPEAKSQRSESATSLAAAGEKKAGVLLQRDAILVGCRVQGFRVADFRVQDSGVRVSGFRVQGSGFRVASLEAAGDEKAALLAQRDASLVGFRVQGFRVSGFEGSWSRVEGSGFGV